MSTTLARREEVAVASAPPPAGRTEREALIVAHMGLVRRLAHRYTNRGESFEDLVQVGMIGLIKAVDRFDPGRHVAFDQFATPTIIGEIRRHFRDRMWGVKVPRALQEANAAVTQAVDHLTSSLQRTPTVHDVGDLCGMSEGEVIDAVAVGSAYRPGPLILDSENGDEQALEVAVDDPGFGRAEVRVLIGSAVARLPLRERRIVMLRFAAGLTQAEIGARLGLSQMHVSRLLTTIVRTLRTDILGGDRMVGAPAAEVVH